MTAEPVSTIAVKNVGRGPQFVDGCGVLAHQEVGDAEDTPHTRALIDAGHLIEITAPTTERARARALRKD